MQVNGDIGLKKKKIKTFVFSTLSFVLDVYCFVHVVDHLCEVNAVVSKTCRVFGRSQSDNKTALVNVVPFYYLLAIFRKLHVVRIR